MRALITSFNKKLGTNPMIARMLFAIPGIEAEFTNPEKCDVVFLVFVAPEADFVLDADMLARAAKRNAPLVIFDFEETFGGKLLGLIGLGGDYGALERFVQTHVPRVYFKREISPDPEWTFKPSFPVYPIDWVLNVVMNHGRHDTRDQFENRPIDIMMSWGYSNECRPTLMGELLKQAGRFSAHFVLTEEDLDVALSEGRKRVFALLHTPHFRRIHISKLMKWQSQSKIAISLDGAGRKCFRHAEASFNCVMATQDALSVVWSYPWVHGENCISLTRKDFEPKQIEEGYAIETLWHWLRVEQGRLYDIYLGGIANNENYHIDRYARNYLQPKIDTALK